jgi:hypothetical protein
MDPVTAAFNAATAALTLATKVWDATPEPLKAQSAGDWAKSVHNVIAFLLEMQNKINAAVGVK